MHEVCLNWLGQKFFIFIRSFIHMHTRVSKSVPIISNYDAAVRLVQNKRRKCRGERKHTAENKSRRASMTQRNLFLLLVKNLISGSAGARIISTQSQIDILEVYYKQILGNLTMISN